mmetsp:Transcript_164/g.368  ORF Transcript_164/g.368 Transcript_164/m.368 type:complete len:207 (-) Transcript_164:770-1390(-)
MPTITSSLSVVASAATAGRSLAGEAAMLSRHALIGASGAWLSGSATAAYSASTACSRSLSALMTSDSASVHGSVAALSAPHATTLPLTSSSTVSDVPALARKRKWRGWSYPTSPMASRTASPFTSPFGQPIDTSSELSGPPELLTESLLLERERLLGDASAEFLRWRPPLNQRAKPPVRRREVDLGAPSALAGRTTSVARLATTPS